MRGRLRVAFGVVGALAALLGVLSVGAPSLVAETEPLATLVGAASGLEPRTLLVLGSAAVGLYLVGAVWRSPDDRLVAGDRSGSERFERVVDERPETVAAPDRALTGNDFDAAVERATAGDRRAMDRIRDRLRRLAVVHLHRDGWDGDSATEAVASGEWTADRTAAALLSEDEEPVAPLRSRIRLWLDPAAERERRIRRTVAAVEALPDSGSHDSDSERDGTDSGDASGASADGERVRGGGVGE